MKVDDDMKPMKQCNRAACRTLIPFDETYCDRHKGMAKREVNKAYDTARQRKEPLIREFYNSNRWRMLSKQTKIRDEYLCQECLRNNIYKPCDVTDHVIEIKDDWDKRWDINNTEAKCHECHNKKTKREAENRNNRKQNNLQTEK